MMQYYKKHFASAEKAGLSRRGCYFSTFRWLHRQTELSAVDKQINLDLLLFDWFCEFYSDKIPACYLD